MPTSYRRRPVVYTAVQWRGWPHDLEGLYRHVINPLLGHVMTPEGGLPVAPWQWIVTGSDGSVTVVTDDVFQRDYERAEEIGD